MTSLDEGRSCSEVAMQVVRGVMGSALLALCMGQTLPAVPQSDAEAVKALATHLGAMKEIKTLHVRFVCEKRLQMLDAPVESAGDLWIRKEEGGAAVRFSTVTPYVSEVLLAQGKVSGRSQHEKTWETRAAGDRPGLTAVMGQLGGWSMGGEADVQRMYAVQRKEGGIPGLPKEMIAEAPGAEGAMIRGMNAADGIESFVLTPTDKDLAKAVKGITLTLRSKTHELVSAEIRTAQDDVTRYWFFGVELNPVIPAAVFTPMGEPGAWSFKSRKAAP